MIRQVRFSHEALGDVERLAQFIAPHNPPAARRLVERLRARAHSLRTLAERGRIAGGPEYREVVMRAGGSAYVMLYRVDPGDVVVLRIWHAKEDRRGVAP